MSPGDRTNSKGALEIDLAQLPFHAALDLATTRSWLEIDLDAIRSNLAAIRRASSDETEVLLPVKADGYGHGAVEVAREAVRCGIRWFGVASLEEALILRGEGIDANILLLTPPSPAELELLVAASVTPVIADLGIAAGLNGFAGREGTVHPVHVEVDTGMGRVGVSWRQALPFLREVMAFPHLKITGIYSHFSSADEQDLAFTRLQLDRFRDLLKVFSEEISPFPVAHISNSAASLRIPDIGLPIIRPGLFIYGVSPLFNHADARRLLPVPAMSFRSRVVYVKSVEKGDSIGYNRSYVAPCEKRIATVAVGYRDGLHFGLSNRGQVLIGGRRCPIVGNICMDMSMVDVTELGGVRLGDPVTLLGSDQKERITAEELAQATSTIPYDVVTKMGNRVPRIYYREGRPFRITSTLGQWELDDRRGE